jgi:hypothetical protein
MQLQQAAPTVVEWRFDPWPEIPPGGVQMEFRLTYEGRLPAASQNDTRATDKHRIRREISKQLAELWKTHPRLRRDSLPPDDSDTALGVIRGIETFDRCGCRFLPLITNDEGIGCGLDILFLRRDQPGSLIQSGGDIDNRIKVLLDALRMPSHQGEISGPADEQPNPFHCLLEDDRLITEFKVTTDRLLTPCADNENLNDVRLVIHVKTIVLDTGNIAAWTF